MPNYYPPASGGAGNVTLPIAESDVTNLTSDLAAKAALASPTFTGHPVGVTEAALNNSTRLSSTAYSDAAVAVETSRASTAEGLLAPLAGPTFTGVVTLPTGAVGTSQTALDRSTKVATTLYTDRAIENATNGLGWSAPTNSVAVTFDRSQAPQGTRTVVTAVIYMTAIYIPVGTVVSNFNCISGATASSCTHSWCALFNNSRVQLAATADDTSGNASFTADTTRTQAVATIASGASATFTTTYTGLHYVGICVVFTGTAPTMRCDASGNTILNGLAPIMTGTSNTTQTTPNAFAFTANALVATSNRDYVWLT